MDIMEKRLLQRFVLDILKSGSFNPVKDKATVDAHGYVIPDNHCIYTFRLCRYSLDVLHIGVGFGVARFDGMGNARASECGTSDSTDSRAFLF